VEEQPTCGRGLAHNMAVPAALAAAAGSLAQNLELHTRALDPGDAMAAQEKTVYERVARNLRSAAADLQSAAAQMAAAADLPMGAHDLAAITTPDVLAAFQGYVEAENELRRLLEVRDQDNQQMLSAIQAQVTRPSIG
jgi:hypothetical protein